MSILTDVREDEHGFTGLTPYAFALAIDENDISLVCPLHRELLYNEDNDVAVEHQCLRCQKTIFTSMTHPWEPFIDGGQEQEFLAHCVEADGVLDPLEAELEAAALVAAIRAVRQEGGFA